VLQRGLEDARFIVYEDEKEMIATNVSTCGLQGNRIRQTKFKLSSQIAKTSY